MMHNLPPGYHEVAYWKLGHNTREFLLINLLAVPLGLLGVAVFYPLTQTLGQRPDPFALDGDGLIWVWILAAVVVTLMLHELAHGLTMQAFGGRPRYGIKWELGALYATAPGYAFRRNDFLWVVFMPLMSLSALAVVGLALISGTVWASVVMVCALANVAGACGDAYIGWWLTRYPATAYVVDEADGVRVFLLND